MKKIMVILLSVMLLQGCRSEIPALKSPCVGVKGSPCGERIPVNKEWLEELNIKA